MSEIPTFKIGSKYYDAGQITDKSLYARKQVTRIDYKSSGSTNVLVSKGMLVGVVYAWANLGGQLYFTLYGSYPFQNFVLYDPYAFSETALEAQGALTVEEQAAAAADSAKSAFEKIMDSLGLSNLSGTLKWAVPVGVVGYIALKLWGEKNKAESQKYLAK